METALKTITQPDLSSLPRESLLRLHEPQTHGNSFMLDGFPALKEGRSWQERLAGFIRKRGVLGMTTNQTLFRQLLETGALDARLRGCKAGGSTPERIWQELYNEAAMEAARLFAPVHERWPWEGRVSQEASALITGLEPLVREVERIAGAMSGVGSFTKVPNVAVGPEAVRRAAATGRVSPNVTLVFSDRHYLDTVEGYLLGLKDLAERLRQEGLAEEAIRQRLSRIHSVNSLFVSRVDRVVDPMISDERVPGLRPGTLSSRPGTDTLGKTAVAQAKIIYRMFEAIFLGRGFPDPERLYGDEEGQRLLAQIERLRELFAELKALGANPQRLLIASSGVKSDQPYHSLLYVLPFLGPWTANTMPEGTLGAVSRWVGERTNGEIAALQGRSMIAEPLPDVPSDSKDWERALLMTGRERKAAGIGEVTPDRVLRQVHEQALRPRGTTLRQLCDTLRDKGAAAFTADEQATLQAIQAKLKGF